MSTATIKVQYVNQPKSLKGPGSVKTDRGVYYKVWPKAKDGGASLDQFAADRTYNVEYETEPDRGYGEKFVIRKILSTSESVVSQSTNGGHAPVATNGREARIERQAAHKVAIQFLALEVQASGREVTLERLFELTDAIAADVSNTEPKPEQASEPEVEI